MSVWRYPITVLLLTGMRSLCAQRGGGKGSILKQGVVARAKRTLEYIRSSAFTVSSRTTLKKSTLALVTDTSYVVTHWHRNCSSFLGPLHFLGLLRTARASLGTMVSLSSLFFATVLVTCVNFRLKYCGGGMAFAQCRSSKLMRLLQAGRSSGNDDKINIVLLFFKLNTLQDGWEGLRTRLKYISLSIIIYNFVF